jgi:hypothetical protein
MGPPSRGVNALRRYVRRRPQGAARLTLRPAGSLDLDRRGCPAATQVLWQALAFEDGSLVSEVVSNYYLAEGRCWSRGEEEQLVKLGWEPAEPPKRTNWINVEYTTSPPTGLVACRAFATLRFVFGLDLDDALLIRMFSSPLRGDTSATSHRPTPVTPNSSIRLAVPMKRIQTFTPTRRLMHRHSVTSRKTTRTTTTRASSPPP